MVRPEMTGSRAFSCHGSGGSWKGVDVFMSSSVSLALPRGKRNHSPRAVGGVRRAYQRNTQTEFLSADRLRMPHGSIIRMRGIPRAHVFPINPSDAMNWDRIEGNWKQLKGRIRDQWGRLTDDELDGIAGRRERLAGCLQ